MTQYQLALESADRYDEQRLSVDKFFTTVISTVFLLGGSLAVFSTSESSLYLRAFGGMFISTIVMVLCIVWFAHVQHSYNRSLTKRFIIRRMEQSKTYPIPHKPFLTEYKIWREDNVTTYRLFSDSTAPTLKRVAALATLWPYILGIASLVSILFLYYFVIEPPIIACGSPCGTLDNARVSFRTWLLIVAVWFFVSLGSSVWKQSRLARYLDNLTIEGGGLETTMKCDSCK